MITKSRSWCQNLARNGRPASQTLLFAPRRTPAPSLRDQKSTPDQLGKRSGLAEAQRKLAAADTPKPVHDEAQRDLPALLRAAREALELHADPDPPEPEAVEPLTDPANVATALDAPDPPGAAQYLADLTLRSEAQTAGPEALRRLLLRHLPGVKRPREHYALTDPHRADFHATVNKRLLGIVAIASPGCAAVQDGDHPSRGDGLYALQRCHGCLKVHEGRPHRHHHEVGCAGRHPGAELRRSLAR